MNLVRSKAWERTFHPIAVPAKAATHRASDRAIAGWAPAFAGDAKMGFAGTRMSDGQVIQILNRIFNEALGMTFTSTIKKECHPGASRRTHDADPSPPDELCKVAACGRINFVKLV